MEKQELKRVGFHDILKYRFLSTPRFSPEGRRIAFAVHQGDLEGNRTLSDLWLYDLDGARRVPLTHTGAEGPFCWTREGDALVVASGRTPQLSDPKPNEKAPRLSRLYSLPVNGGEARFLADVGRTVTALWDTPWGLLIQDVDPREPKRFEGADYRVLEQIPFCANGKGFTAGQRTRLSLLARGASEGVDLTPEGMDVNRVRLSKDGRYALLTATDYGDVMPQTTGVWELNLETRELRELLPQGQYTWSCAAPFGEGILLTGTDMKRYGLNENVRFFLANRDGGDLRCLTPDLDTSLNNTVTCDCRYGVGDNGESFRPDGERAWFVTTDEYHAPLFLLNGDGSVRRITSELRSVDDFDVFEGRVIAVGLAGLALQELFLVEPGEGDCWMERRLTDFNAAALEGVDLSVPEYVRLENGTPEGLDCWYMRPVGFEVGRRYPTILNIHGGPKCAFGDVFVHEMQCWAAEGFAVLFCNPRGSDGRGNRFADIRGKYGTVDYEDLMLFVDWAVRTLPFVDESRLGVTGGSYGGFMTNWIVGHPRSGLLPFGDVPATGANRFRAAVTQRSICNWVSMVGMSDIGYYFVADQQGADIGEDVTALWDRSPLKYAEQMVTPTLIIHSDED
ncbi:MAG: S9 family peptidase, partial [Synergistaceae bacterium]|nr:S9 family peptidase [Synergistaceae bacterium]